LVQLISSSYDRRELLLLTRIVSLYTVYADVSKAGYDYLKRYRKFAHGINLWLALGLEIGLVRFFHI